MRKSIFSTANVLEKKGATMPPVNQATEILLKKSERTLYSPLVRILIKIILNTFRIFRKFLIHKGLTLFR
ncbi:MAG: hypothetical protein ABIJ36_01070 [Patescibacteria group bacterium]|nr:hypothetical protein [Patescibacteria group bacterium]